MINKGCEDDGLMWPLDPRDPYVNEKWTKYDSDEARLHF